MSRRDCWVTALGRAGRRAGSTWEPGGIVICESETGLVLPAEVGGMTLKKQYKYGKVLLWKYGKPRQSAGEGDAE